MAGLVNFRELYEQVKGRGYTMRRRFLVYLLSLVCGFCALIVILLSLFGIINPADARLELAFDHQLESSAALIESNEDALAAYAISLSEQISGAVEKALADEGISFEDLANNEAVLTALQSEAYHAVYTNMQLTPCSGAFYFLDTTVNKDLLGSCYNGVYLKFANLSAENTIHNTVCLFRGAYPVARENGFNLHSTWQLEMREGVFPQVDAMIDGIHTSLSRSYLLTSVYTLPDTWEQVRLLCVPILDGDGNTIGACGFEISELYFRLSHKTSDGEQDHLVCALLTETENGYIGQIAGSRSGYTPAMESEFTVERGERFDTFLCGGAEFVGKCQPVTIGESGHIVAVMLSAEQYDSVRTQGRLRSIAVLSIVVILAVASSAFLSKRYVAPILRDLEQLKSKDRAQASSSIPEINDFIEFLAQQDAEHEEQLRQLEQQHQSAQSEAAKAQSELSRIVDRKRREIDPDSFDAFLRSLKTLTRKEREVFDLYLEGKTAKEIVELLGFTDNALKFHNKNLYSKLGVTSRKELLLYARLMKDEGGKADG